MNNEFKHYNLSVPVLIGIAPEYLAKDVAMLSLLTGDGEINESKYSKESFIKQIKEGNVLVVLINDDPIAYAVINDSNIEEIYISYSFKNTELEGLMREYVKTL